MDLASDIRLLVAVVIVIAGIAGALILRGLLIRLVVLGLALAVAAYIAGYIRI